MNVEFLVIVEVSCSSCSVVTKREYPVPVEFRATFLATTFSAFFSDFLYQIVFLT
jgi:hypothetical protein